MPAWRRIGTFWQDGPAWESRIRELLDCHQIRLVGQDGFYLVYMYESHDGNVHMYEFERVIGQPSALLPVRA
ncbi:MAG: hypothetical protein OXG16_13950 [Rhodospirillales bacterium]|nr:hypothetical protein [Rhodospirillales bacterium]MDE0711175.1 hypothetical protein [Rhodospirillales bacterium]